jgi:hypothetical protein
LPYTVEQNGDVWISYTPALDLGSQGSTEKRAVANLHEAIELFLASRLEHSSLDWVLRDCGLESEREPAMRRVAKEPDYLVVPISWPTR